MWHYLVWALSTPHTLLTGRVDQESSPIISNCESHRLSFLVSNHNSDVKLMVGHSSKDCFFVLKRAPTYVKLPTVLTKMNLETIHIF